MRPRARWMLVVASLFSCGETESPVPRAPAGTGAVEGTVRVLGDSTPEPTPITNTTDPEICGRKHTLDDLVVSPENGGVRYAIAALVDLPSEVIPEPPPQRVTLDNVGCRFSPHALVTTVGSTLEARNSDPLLHTVHLYGPANINISLPQRGTRSTRTLDLAGTYVVKCDIHGWMQAFVRVDPHPFHAVTDEKGSFRIEGVPVGLHRLEVWHEKLGAQQTEIRIEEGVRSSVVIEYPYEGQ